jgi:hypothetical protein
MKEIGWKTNSMAKVLKLGQMVQNMKATMFMGKSMVMEDLLGLMVVHTQDNSKKIIFKVKVLTTGLMVVSL